MAKVLCLDGDFDKARDIYEYALQKLPSNHKGRDVCGALPMTDCFFILLFFTVVSHFFIFLSFSSHPSSSSPFFFLFSFFLFGTSQQYALLTPSAYLSSPQKTSG